MLTKYKIVSFGDSFVFGSELKGNKDGSKSWIGLAAQQLGVDYETFAVPGCGNEHIARQIYYYFSKNTNTNVLAIINWTWASRWDFYLLKEIKKKLSYKQILEDQYNIIAGANWPPYHEFAQGIIGDDKKINDEINQWVDSLEITEPGKWFTLGDTCVPEKLKWINNDTDANNILNFYKTYMKQSVLWNNFRNLQTINSVQQYIENKKINVIQTYMDYELFNKDELLCDESIIQLQKQIHKKINLFHKNLNFLDWARSKNFEITPSPGDHPLEEAHQTACDLWIERYQKKLFSTCKI
jgi:hypothetical protein